MIPLRRFIVCLPCLHHFSRASLLLLSIHTKVMNIISKKSKDLYLLTKTCKSVNQLKQVLAQIIQTNISNHLLSLSWIISFSATSHQPDLGFASLIFSHLEKPNSFVYNSMIRGFTNSNNPNRAIVIYLQMNRNGPISDKYTYPFVLKACALIWDIKLGKSVHGQITQMGFSFDGFARSSLVAMYSDLGESCCARLLFDEITEMDPIVWNSMIGGYLKCEEMDKACELFDNMACKNVSTYNVMMGGYVKFGCLDLASKLFTEMIEKDVISWNTMIGAHSRLGSVDMAWKLFTDAPERNLMTWSAIISGLSQGGRYKDGLEVFKGMLGEGLKPNQAILVSVLSCCARLGALEQGVWIHRYIEKNEIEVDDFLGASLVDMYSKCGFLQGSISMFEKIKTRGVCSWTSMIYGFAIHGHSLKALDLFSEMEILGTRPNEITFVAILCACSHAGLVETGREMFDKMIRDYKIMPNIEHYSCMVDLFSRANLFDEARGLIKAMPFQPDVYVWGALSSGLRIYGERSLMEDEELRENLVRLEPRDSGAYILMSNIYASIEKWDSSTRMRRMMEGMGLKKNPGCSLIEVDQVVHEFLAGGRLHPLSRQIYEMLDQIYREIKCKALL